MIIPSIHASEKSTHNFLKRIGGAVLSKAEYAVFYEALHCDIIGHKKINDERYDLSIEGQTRVHHATENYFRDIQVARAKGVIFLTPDLPATAALTRKLMRELPPNLWNTVGVACVSTFLLLHPELNEPK